MKKLVQAVLLSAFLFALTTSTASAAKGYVAYTDGSILVIDAPSGYVCCTLYSFEPIFEGNYVVGDFETLGMQKLYNVTMDSSNDVFVDEACLSEEDAQEWVAENS
jgi:hypothetical protein